VLDVGLTVNVHDGGIVVGQVSTSTVRINTGLICGRRCGVRGDGVEMVNTLDTWRLGRCGDVGSVHTPPRGRILIAVC
jgi:hypothetical protein